MSEELAIKMSNPYYFTHKALKAGFHFNLDSQHNDHISSLLTITPKHLEIEKKILLIIYRN